jgi:hypothetical protein
MIRKSIAQKSAVYHYQLADNPHAWLIMLAPGCGIEEARRVLDLQYPGRVLAVRGHATQPTNRRK